MSDIGSPPRLHVTRLRRKLSGAIFRYLALRQGGFGLTTPEHVNKPLGSKSKINDRNTVELK